MCPYAPPPPTQVHDYSGWGGLSVGDVCRCTKRMWLYVLEPRPHHTLLDSFEEYTAETEEDIDNTHMWCEV